MRKELEEIKMKLTVADPKKEWLTIHDLAAYKAVLEAKIESLAAKELFKATPEELGKAAVEGAKKLIGEETVKKVAVQDDLVTAKLAEKVKDPEPSVVDHTLTEKDLVPAGAIAAMAEVVLNLPKAEKAEEPAKEVVDNQPAIRYI